MLYSYYKFRLLERAIFFVKNYKTPEFFRTIFRTDQLKAKLKLLLAGKYDF